MICWDNFWLYEHTSPTRNTTRTDPRSSGLIL